jgi:hypothetical protein
MRCMWKKFNYKKGMMEPQLIKLLSKRLKKSIVLLSIKPTLTAKRK